MSTKISFIISEKEVVPRATHVLSRKGGYLHEPDQTFPSGTESRLFAQVGKTEPQVRRFTKGTSGNETTAGRAQR